MKINHPNARYEYLCFAPVATSDDLNIKGKNKNKLEDTNLTEFVRFFARREPEGRSNLAGFRVKGEKEGERACNRGEEMLSAGCVHEANAVNIPQADRQRSSTRLDPQLPVPVCNYFHLCGFYLS